MRSSWGKQRAFRGDIMSTTGFADGASRFDHVHKQRAGHRSLVHVSVQCCIDGATGLRGSAGRMTASQHALMPIYCTVSGHVKHHVPQLPTCASCPPSAPASVPHIWPRNMPRNARTLKYISILGVLWPCSKGIPTRTACTARRDNTNMIESQTSNRCTFRGHQQNEPRSTVARGFWRDRYQRRKRVRAILRHLRTSATPIQV